jgi:ribonuclease T2
MKKIVLLSIAVLGLAVCAASAQVKLDGSFVAAKECPALQSIKKKTNPGDISIATGQTYKLLGKNREQASHYWIVVPGAQPESRWVAVECGSANGKMATAPVESQKAKKTSPALPTAQVKDGQKDGKPFYVLALSWEPAFCEAMAGKAECKAQTQSSYDASHFSLHGLWPQPRRNVFCNVDKALMDADDNHRWESLPEPEISAETRKALDQVMPGTQSSLQRHEWIKHGTCYPGGNAENYFKDGIRLVTAVNTSPVQSFMEVNIGKTINTADLRAKFDEAFGAGAGERVRVSCKDDGNRQLITEITIGLKGDFPSDTSMKDLIMASSPTDAGCPAGVVDTAGRQ